MNCLEAQALLSAAHDGEAVSDADLAAARAHCAECEDCTAFEAGLKYLDKLPVTTAPKELVGLIMEAVAPLAEERAILRLLEADRADAESVGTEVPVPEDEPPAVEDEPAIVEPAPVPAVTEPSGFSWFAGPVRWATLGAAGALAAAALIAFVVVGIGGGTPAAERATVDTAGAPALDLTYGNSGQAAAPPAEVVQPAPATAPDYVLYKDYVYSPGALLADANSATPTIGTLSTAFASQGGALPVTVYRSPLTDGSVVVKGPDGLRLFSPVIRMMASVRYQLTSGKPIDRFGVWPVLPTRFPTPANSAGTPTFVNAGTDALGVVVFSATGRPVTEGFAVAPGTSTSDPAGGNPNWTWWVPAPANP
jgi:hypothetical protein